LLLLVGEREPDSARGLKFGFGGCAHRIPSALFARSGHHKTE
jgi:hypothetical protein